jgi:hypothetical protein
MEQWNESLVKMATLKETHIVRGYTCQDYPGLSITHTLLERTKKPVFTVTLSESGLAV